MIRRVSAPRQRRERTRHRRFSALARWALFAFSVFAAGSSAEPVRGQLAEVHLQWNWSTPGNANYTPFLDLGDLDGNGSIDLAALVDIGSQWYDNTRWFTATLSGSYRQTAAGLPDTSGSRLIRIAEDSQRSYLVVFRNQDLLVLDGLSKSAIRTVPLPTTEVLDGDVLDVDRDGDLEAFVCSTDGLFEIDFDDGTVLATRYGFTCTDFASGQTDDDPQLELVLAGNSLGGFVLDGLSLQIDWAYLDGFGANVEIIDIDFDGRDDLLANIDESWGIQALSPFSGAVLWQRPEFTAGTLAAAQLDGAGPPEFVWSHDYNSGLFAGNAATGIYLGAVEPERGGGLAISAADVDSDGQTEIVWLGRGLHGEWPLRLFVANGTSWELEFASPLMFGPFAAALSGDFDLDGSKEIITAASSADAASNPGVRLLRWTAGSGFLESSTAFVPSSSASFNGVPAVSGQLDGDPQPEVCVLHGAGYSGEAEVTCIDSASGSVQWSVGLPSTGEPGSLAIGELDGDLHPEIVVSASRAWVLALEGESGWLKWQTPSLGWIDTDLTTLRIGNVLGDSSPEVVAGGTSIYSGSEILLIDADSGALEVPILEPPSGAETFDVVNLDADPELEILASHDGGQISVLDPLSANYGPTLADFPDQISALRVLDWTSDAQLDFVAAVSGTIAIWDGALGDVTWTSPFTGWESGARDSLWVDNLDDDQALEVAINTVVGLAVFEGPLATVFASGFESGDTAEWSLTNP